MHDWQSLSHVRWDCKYHVVIAEVRHSTRAVGKGRLE